MGLLDSIRERFGGGGSAPPQGKMRQPPQAPPEDPVGPGRDTGPEPAGPAGPPPENPDPPQPRGREAPPQDHAEPAPSPSPTGGRDTPDPNQRPEPSNRGRPERGSTLDVDRPADTPDDDLDLPPQQDKGPGPAAGPQEPRSGPDRPDRQPPDRQPRERQSRTGGREEPGGDVPDAPRDYNLDLPEPGAEGDDRLERIERQNNEIIGLLEDIRDQMAGGRR